MWEPVHPNTSRKSLPDELKRVISRRLWDTDGSCGGGQADEPSENTSAVFDAVGGYYWLIGNGQT